MKDLQVIENLRVNVLLQQILVSGHLVAVKGELFAFFSLLNKGQRGLILVRQDQVAYIYAGAQQRRPTAFSKGIVAHLADKR